jgi:hypothetical protein
MGDRVIRIKAFRDRRLVTIGYIGAPGGPGYVQSPRFAERFSEMGAVMRIGELLEQHPSMILDHVEALTADVSEPARV